MTIEAPSDILLRLSAPEVLAYIHEHVNADEKKLILKHKSVLGIPTTLIADQITGLRKAKLKLPTLHNTPGVVYPPSINLEQCSSELTAAFKANLLRRYGHFKRGVDLTGGFGVDTYWFSKICDTIDYVEPNISLLQLAAFNHTRLGARNIAHHAVTADSFLETTNNHFDFVYLDPSRRKDSKKVFRLADCSPDPAALLPVLNKYADRILIKTSPLLDIHQGLSELPSTEKIIVVSVDNDCKELLFLQTKGFSAEPVIECVNLHHNRPAESFTFTSREEKDAACQISDPQTFLYEPSAAVLKGGAFQTVGKRYNLLKLHMSTHLYTSDKLIQDFPGRVFKIEQLNPDYANRRTLFPERKANVLTRNYPASPEDIKKKWELSDGGDIYLIGFSGQKKKFLALASRIK